MNIVFERRGEGPPLVLLHGIGHRRQAWEPVFNLLAAEREVIAVDLPGSGASPSLDAGHSYEIDAVVERLAETFDRLGLDRPHIAGNSLGGLFALEAADRGLVSSATALSPAGFYDEAGFRYAVAVLHAVRLGASIPGALLERLVAHPMQRSLMFRVLYGRPHLVDPDVLIADAGTMAAAPGFAGTVRAGAGVRFTGELRDVPVTIAWGTRDRILSASQALRARTLLPHVDHVWLPGCGHVPMHDDPALVAGVILRTSSTARPVAAV